MPPLLWAVHVQGLASKNKKRHFLPMPKVYIRTYGCQMNERDSEQVARQFVEKGYTLTSQAEEADVILLNTCSVRDLAEQKALGKMGMMGRIKRERPQVVLGFMGCMAQSRGEELVKLLPQVDLVVGTQQFHRVADYADRLHRARNAMDDLIPEPIVDIREEAGSQNTIRDHQLKPRQVTAFVSIMQGCNMRCTFCIVPDTRGAERGRPMEEIEAEVRELVHQGVREVTLLGQIVNLYGRHEFSKRNGLSPFVQLLERLNNIDGLERIRFTSPHPIGFRSDLVEAFSRLNKLCEHVHLPLQSGSDAILKKMRRAYTVDKYKHLVEALRAANPRLTFTTDIIVGFPGETEDDFAATRRMVEWVGFENAFIFKYSERCGTPAAEWPDQIPQEIKEARNQELLAVVETQARRSAEALRGCQVEVLVEGPSKTNPTRLAGRTRTNKIVVFEGKSQHIGQLLPVTITDPHPFTLYGDCAVH